MFYTDVPIAKILEKWEDLNAAAELPEGAALKSPRELEIVSRFGEAQRFFREYSTDIIRALILDRQALGEDHGG